MKKFFFLAIPAALLAVACNKSAPVVDDSLDYVAPEENISTPEPVVFGTNVYAVTKTKAQGGIDAWNGKQSLRIFGFDRKVTDFTTEAFIDDVEADSPADGTSGSINVYNPAVVQAQEPFYYSGNTCYDFYGYYVDDAVVGTVVRTAESIVYPVTIDGGQDLMIAKADQAVDVQGATSTVAEQHAYSAYSARRGVQPKLVFQHLLSRFTFKIVKGTNSESAGDVQITSLTLAAKAEGNLCVVGAQRGVVATSTGLVDFELREKSAEGVLGPLATNLFPTDDATQIGESIMVFPGEDSYTFTLKMKQTGVNTEPAPQSFTVTPAMVDTDSAQDGLQPATAFEAGKNYTITISIYGLEEVKITAELTPWVEGGSVVIDPDDPSTWE